MNYAELTDDELRLEVALRCGYRLTEKCKNGVWLAYVDKPLETPAIDSIPFYSTNSTAAIALLESTDAEYNFGKRITGTPKPVYDVIIWGYYSAFGDDYEATADTLPRAACVAWLMWKDGKEAQDV